MSGRRSRRLRTGSRQMLADLLESARQVATTAEDGDGCAVYQPDGSTHILEMTADGPVVKAATDGEVRLYLTPTRGQA